VLGPQAFREIVSGRRRDAGAVAWRALLRLGELPYAAVVRLRNGRYDRGRVDVHRANVPVVSVGNVTLGGTGKTPMVAWLATWLAGRGLRPGIISRGYGSQNGVPNDEARELAQRLPGVPHQQHPQRVKAISRLLAGEAVDAVVLDDGFQHRRLHRDLDIVLIDALEPFGFDHLFPRGTLREPLASLARADVLVLTRSDLVSDARRRSIHSRLSAIAPQAQWCELVHRPAQLRNVQAERRPLAELEGLRIAAFCGIGNPAGFRQTLENCGCRIRRFDEFPDHHRYRQSDVDRLDGLYQSADIDAVLCTHKDLVKLDGAQLGGRPLWAVAIEATITTGQDRLERLLEQVVPSSRREIGPRPDNEPKMGAARANA